MNSRFMEALGFYLDAGQGDREAAVIDLLTDLRLHCHRDGLDFGAALSASEAHFEAERRTDDPGGQARS